MRKVLLIISGVLLLSGAAWAQSNTPPSLAEVARKVRAQRAKKDISKVPLYTNETLPKEGVSVSVLGKPGAPPAAPAAEGEEGAAAAPKAEAGGKGEAEECDEQCWRDRFRVHRAKIRTTERELDILQREYDLARTQYYQDPNQAVREQYSNTTAGGHQLQALLNQIDEKQAEIQRLQRELSDLEDELRRSGGQPGWAREE
jgi:hypothetical protein